MGYTTEFVGRFKFDSEPGDEEVKRLLKGLSRIRRMKRNVGFEYGVEGEFYFGSGLYGQNRESNIIDYNVPPKTQPGLWCKWELVKKDGDWYLQWNGAEKFYNLLSGLFTYVIKC